MNLTLGAGDEENGRPLLGGLGGSDAGQGGSGSRGAAGFTLPAAIVRIAAIIASTGGITPGFGCAAAAAYLPLPAPRRVGKAQTGDAVLVLAEGGDGWTEAEVRKTDISTQPCVTLTTENGVRLTCSRSTPITTRASDGALEAVTIAECVGRLVPVLDGDRFGWEEIVTCEDAGDRLVVLLDCGGATFAAGDEPGRYIFTHNKRDFDIPGDGAPRP